MISDQTIGWIESLAQQELQIDSGSRKSHDVSIAKTDALNVATATFLREVQAQFSFLANLFNSRVGSTHSSIAITRALESADFSMNRNGFELRVVAAQPSVVQINCVRLGRMEAQSKDMLLFSGTVEARFAAFHEIEWHFLGAAVSPEQLARHYLTEFIQTSRPAV